MKQKSKKYQNVLKNDNNEIIVEPYPKIRQPFIENSKFGLPDFPSCKQNFCVDYTYGHFCWTLNVSLLIMNKHQND